MTKTYRNTIFIPYETPFRIEGITLKTYQTKIQFRALRAGRTPYDQLNVTSISVPGNIRSIRTPRIKSRHFCWSLLDAGIKACVQTVLDTALTTEYVVTSFVSPHNHLQLHRKVNFHLNRFLPSGRISWCGLALNAEDWLFTATRNFSPRGPSARDAATRITSSSGCPGFMKPLLLCRCIFAEVIQVSSVLLSYHSWRDGIGRSWNRHTATVSGSRQSQIAKNCQSGVPFRLQLTNVHPVSWFYQRSRGPHPGREQVLGPPTIR